MKLLQLSLVFFLTFSVFAQKNQQKLFKKAVKCTENGEYETAIKDFNQLLSEEPTSVKALLYRGEAFVSLGKFEAAESDFNRVLLLDKKNARAFYLIGKEKHRKGDYKGAIEDYNTAIKYRLFDFDVFYMMAKAKIKIGDNVGAIKDLEFILDQEPDNQLALLQKGIALQNMKLYKEADKELTKVIKFSPECPSAYSYRGFGRVELGDNEGAIEDFNQAIILGEGSDKILYFRGLAKYKLGDHDGALEDLVDSKRKGYLEAVNTIEQIEVVDSFEAKSR